METLGDMENLTQQEKDLQRFLAKMASPIVRKERKNIKMY